MKHASIITLGCKVNSFDTAVLWEGLEKKGFAVSDKIEKADIYVINTCTVTNSAGSQSRQVIRKVKRLNPSSRVIVTGCYAQVSPDEVSDIEGVDYVVGNREKNSIIDIVDTALEKDVKRVVVGNIFDADRLEQRKISSFQKKSRAVLKIQDGCEAFCSYCIIPYARGRSRSLSVEKVEEQACSLAESGYREIVLTGIHLGGYGLDFPEKHTLLDLLKRLDSLDINARFRISSVEPAEIDDEMLDFLVSSDKVCRHLHIPLQSGDKETLRRMGRNYSPSEYLKRVEMIASKWKGAGIGIDVIAGFPGEDEAAFMNSYNLVKEIPATYLHVFPYSRRDGTPAATMPGQVGPGEIKARCAELRALGEIKKEAFCRNNLGKKLEVVALEEKSKSVKALSDNYLNIIVDEGEIDYSAIFKVEVERVEGSTCFGRSAF